MLQVFQNLYDGELHVDDIPYPRLENNKIIVSSNYSLLSSGTERMLIEFSKANLIDKAKMQPEKVKEVISKIKSTGFLETYDAVKSKLNQPMPIGYCNVGTILEVGDNVRGFKIGDRVASNGPHCEIFSVSPRLCAIVPDNVKDESAAFTVLGSIGLQGIRLAKPTIGETFLVIGLGLIGQLTAQILRANGCDVLATDIDQHKCEIAESFGIKTFQSINEDETLGWINLQTNNVGVDGVLITASTSSNQPMDIAAKACRNRGRIILVGVTGLNLKRDLLYKKELTFQVSCSYGPGRYDEQYENKGIDYPIGFVRWTEERNFQAFLKLLSEEKVLTEKLITKRFKINDAAEAYKLITSKSNHLGILFKYKTTTKNKVKTIKIGSKLSSLNSKLEKFNLSVIGAGNYSSRILVPAFAKAGANFYAISASNGLNPTNLAKKYGFKLATTDNDKIFSSKANDIVVIATRHNSHAELVIQAIKNQKKVFVEKPLCLNLDELIEIKNTYYESVKKGIEPFVMVGFNRRFAPHILKIKDLLRKEPGKMAINIFINSGYMPKSHWLYDKNIGGGRLLGEACHFIDLVQFLSTSKVAKWNKISMPENNEETSIITMEMDNGSIGSIHYLSNGHNSFPKERIEIFINGKIIQLDNYRKLKGFGWKNFNNHNLFKQDKGQNNCVKLFLANIKKGIGSPIPIEDLFETSRITIEMSQNSSSF